MKSQTLKENKDFRRLYYRGKSSAGALLITYAMKNRKNETRIGITASKKTGKAYERNRARRVIRAAYFPLEENISGGWDLVFVARSRTSKVKMQSVQSQMIKQLRELGVLNENDDKSS